MKKAKIWWAYTVVAGLASGLALAQSKTTDCSSVANDQARLKCYDEQAARQKARAAAPAAAAAPATSSAPASAAQAAASASAAQAAASAPAAAPAAPPVAASAPAAPARAASATAAPAPKAASGANEFGAESIQKQPAEHSHASEQITARVSSVTTKVRGDYRVTLEDGHVWEETQHTGGPPPAAGETVTIRRGALGSYFLTRPTGGLALRVKRVN